MGEYHVKCFESDNNDSRLSSIYPSFALSDFHLPYRFESLSADTPLYTASEVPPDPKRCSPQFLQPRFTTFRTMITFSRILLYEIGLFVYLLILCASWIFCLYLSLNRFIYLFVYVPLLCASWIFCFYLSLCKWTPLNFRIFLREPGNI